MRKDLNIYKALDYIDFSKRLSSVQDKDKMIVDSGSDHLKYYDIIEMKNFLVGIRHEIEGAYPIVRSTSKSDQLLLGVDHKLILISINEHKINWIIEFDTPFVEMFFHDNSNSLTIVEECGVGKWNFQGIKDWFVGTDLIQHYLVENDFIIVSHDSGKTKISTKTGEVL